MQKRITSHSDPKVHEYLGMTIDFSTPGKVQFSMLPYINNLLAKCPADLTTGISATPAAQHLFQENPDATRLSQAQAETFHHLTAKLLCLCKHTHPDLQTPDSCHLPHDPGPAS